MAVPTKTYSVQPRFTGRAVQPTGWAWIDYLFRTFRRSNIPAYGTWQRDVYLAEIWKVEPIMAGIYNAFTERVQTRQWKVTGGKIKATRGARVLNASENGQGFEYMLGLWAGDFIHTDKGVMGEKGRRRKGSVVGPVMGLQHIDATRMVPNFRRDVTPRPREAHWVYLPQEGEPVRIPDMNLIRIIPQPSGRDKFRGWGYCTTSRLHDALEMMLGFLIYYRQKIGNLPPQLIAIINGLSMEQFEAAYASYETGRKTKDSDIYPGIFFLGSDNPETPVSIDTTQFSGLPDGFDWTSFAEWWVKVVALNIGEASGEYWLLQNVGLGQAGYAVQALTARGRGAGKFMYEVEMRVNLEVMPHGVTFAFDTEDDEEDQQRADILATNVGTIERMAKAGVDRGEAVFTVDEVRRTAIEIGVLDQEIAGEDVPFEVGAMLKSAAGIGEPQVSIYNDGRVVEVKPLLTGKTADKARELYKILEGYYVPRMGGNGPVASLERVTSSSANRDAVKGGPGSGWFGPPRGTHVGRTRLTEWEGAQLTFEGRISDKAKAVILAEYKSIPEFARKNVREIKVTAAPGHEFEAGGQQFRAGASWTPSTNTITLHRAEGHIEWAKEGYTRRILSHEVGHAFNDRWRNMSVEESLRVLKDHPDWFRMDGFPKKGMESRIEKEAPLWTSRNKFLSAWRAGEDGVTSYSKAWAKERWGYSETVAEMSMQALPNLTPRGLLGRAGLLSLWEMDGAGNLGRAFLDAMDAMEARSK